MNFWKAPLLQSLNMQHTHVITAMHLLLKHKWGLHTERNREFIFLSSQAIMQYKKTNTRHVLKEDHKICIDNWNVEWLSIRFDWFKYKFG